MTLLEKAKQRRRPRHRILRVGPEAVELAVAWLRDEVGYAQVCDAIGVKGSNAYNFLANILHAAVRSGDLRIVATKPGALTDADLAALELAERSGL